MSQLLMLRFLLGKPKGTEAADGSVGLVIESAPRGISVPAFAKLARIAPGVTFDLLTSNSEPALGFRRVFQVRRRFGGIRLLLKAATEYRVVVLFWAGLPGIRSCRAAALLLMRPERFFVFNEFGDGFWLERANLPIIDAHLSSRYRDNPLYALWSVGRQIVSLVRRLPGAVICLGRMAVAGFFLIPAFAILTLLRLCYDRHDFRFRLFGKAAAAPRRDFKDQPDQASETETAAGK